MTNRSENEAALIRAGGGRRGRHGCLGCLGCLGTLVGVLAFGTLVVLVLTAVLAPWGFYLGGSFHIIPGWQGWGTLHAKSGDYAVFVRFWPSFRRGSQIHPTSRLTGVAYLCAPRGQRFRMRAFGNMRLYLPVHTDGEAISLRLLNWPVLTGSLQATHRPMIDLVGHWKNPDLVMDDHSSLHRAFNQDGSVMEKTPANLPYNGEVVPVTLKAGTKDEFEAACRAAR